MRVARISLSGGGKPAGNKTGARQVYRGKARGLGGAEGSSTPTSTAPHFLESFGGTIPVDGKRRRR
jgi:hypothetical protein